MEANTADTVLVVSRRMVRPSYGAMPTPSSEDIHLTPWDMYCVSVKYIQRGILLPKPPSPAEESSGFLHMNGEISLVDTLTSSLARALGRYYNFAGRLAVEEHDEGKVTIQLRCTGDGAELVHAVAPGVAVADILGSVYTPSSVVWAFFPLNGMRGVDVAIDSSIPVMSAQVTELADGVFISISMNHTVGDGTSFWELFNAWSEINQGDKLMREPAPTPVHKRWFVDTSPVLIPLPLSTLQNIVRRFEFPPLREGFFTFSAASIKKLKTKANDEMGGSATISSLQALLAHLWRAVTQARCLPMGKETSYFLTIGCRGRMRGIPLGYLGNAVALRMIRGCAVGEILEKGLGWTAWQLNRAVASFDEAATREWLDHWAREPTFYSPASSGGSEALVTTSSPRFDVYGNDFGWGKPVGVRSGCGDRRDGKVTVFEGPKREGSISLELTLVPEAMERLVADHEFMEAVTVPPA